MIDVTDIEMVILGIVEKRGPCTPYFVRKQFEHSPSPHFSSSPGSIYPIIARLESKKWLLGRDDNTGKRNRKMYRISVAGRRALRKWLTPPLPRTAVGLTYDPLRVRMYFLNSLSPDEMTQFFDETIEQLQNELDRARRDLLNYDRQTDGFSWLAAKCGIKSLEARLRFMRDAASHVLTECDESTQVN